MNWLEITVNTESSRLDCLTSALEAQGVDSMIIEDESEYRDFLEKNKQYWDYVDEEFSDSIKGLCRVKFYLEATETGASELSRLREELKEYELLSALVKDEDWENNWKKYYKPIPIGERLVVVPAWEGVPADGRIPLKLDPGLIFGTGSHATTRMCLEVLDGMDVAGAKVLDLGCGSGILAIAALLLGAGSAVGCDIDPKAPDVVMSNAALSGIGDDRLRAVYGDVLSDGEMVGALGGRVYDVVLANIVSDVIIALSPKTASWLKAGGTFVCSGIIEGRQPEVEAALKAAGLKIERHLKREDWHCYICILEE